MIQKLKAMKANKKGFTLAELLIVVAILAVLAAIAVPIFATQLENARERVDAANLRAAVSMAEADFLSYNRKATTVYTFKESNGDSMIISGTGTGANFVPDKAGDFAPQSSNNSGTIVVTLNADGSIASAVWGTAPT